MIPASYNDDTLPVSGRDDGPARPCARSQGRGCARPASEGSLDESASRLEGLRRVENAGRGCRDRIDDRFPPALRYNRSKRPAPGRAVTLAAVIGPFVDRACLDFC